ncbi:protein of unknown function [Candidatus Promineifilum breve]|uniref:Uncharacterized protein n=1 Tax=Candidatus Promineifilum breve TaxID=1806508 RepID=A0A160T395_9CHLR|nr:protein of unknown function [Candidatus Promineifilum breve]
MTPTERPAHGGPFLFVGRDGIPPSDVGRDGMPRRRRGRDAIPPYMSGTIPDGDPGLFPDPFEIDAP